MRFAAPRLLRLLAFVTASTIPLLAANAASDDADTMRNFFHSEMSMVIEQANARERDIQGGMKQYCRSPERNTDGGTISDLRQHANILARDYNTRKAAIIKTTNTTGAGVQVRLGGDDPSTDQFWADNQIA